MRSYAAGEWAVLLEAARARVAAVPLLRAPIAATACVVGAVIGELPSSIQDGLGGAILNFNQYYSLQPHDLWATNLVAAALGIVFFLAIVLAEKLRRPPRRRSSSHEIPDRTTGRSSRSAPSRRRSRAATSTALQDIDLDVEPRRVRLADRPVGLRQVDAAPRRSATSSSRPPGRSLVNGKSAHQARLDRDYGIVFQDAVLYDWRTVAKNIALPLELLGWDRQQRARRASREMLDLVELSGFGDHYPWQLSGGMQQRVSIARALSFSPALLLMDEPFGALDEMTRERLNLELLGIWQETGSTVDLRHALDLRGGVPLHARRRDVPAPRPDRGHRARRPEAAPQLGDARGPAVLRARDGGARAAARRRRRPRRRGGWPRASVTATVDAGARPPRRSAQAASTGSRPSLVFAAGLAALAVGARQRSRSSASCCRAFSDIVSTLWDEKHALWQARLVHVQGGARRLRDRLGASAFVVRARRRALRRRSGVALMPYAIAANAIPIIAFAPISNVWFDPL